MAMTASAKHDEQFEQLTRPQSVVLAKFFRGLGDPLRLQMLQLLLQHGELTVNQLAALTEQAQPKISHHIACLRWCGYVSTRIEGRTTFNSVKDTRVAQCITLALSFAQDNANFVSECERIDEGAT